MKRPVPDGFMTSPPHSVSMPRIAVAVTFASAVTACGSSGMVVSFRIQRRLGVNACIVRSRTSCVAFGFGSP